jgi:hypothetical protein
MVCSLPQKVTDFSTISTANTGQLLWQGALKLKINKFIMTQRKYNYETQFCSRKNFAL